MNGKNEPNGPATVAVLPGTECPLCHRAEHRPLDAHLLDQHTPEQLAELVAKFVQEREETGSVR